MRLRDKLHRMESGEQLLDLDDLGQQTEAHGNRFQQKKDPSKKESVKSEKSGG